MKDFNIMSDGLVVEFICPDCQEKVSYELSSIPSPDWGGDTAADSENSDDEFMNCPNCGHSFCIDIFANIYEGNIMVTDLDTNTEIDPINLIELYEDDEEDMEP